MENYYIITFENTQGTLNGESMKVLVKENKINTKGIYFRDTLGYKIIEL